MTVFNTGPHANTTDFRAGDVGVVRKHFGHYEENTGDDVQQFLEVFKAPTYEAISLANRLSHVPPSLLSAHRNIDEATLSTFPRGT